MYYVYVHRRSTDHSIFYVGKGKGVRAWSTNGRSEFWIKTRNKHGLIVEIVLEDLTEEQAYNNETEFISWYGRRDIGTGCLVNLTDGGPGTMRHRPSEKALRVYSEMFSGLKNPKADRNVYEFVNIHTGVTEELTRFELQQKYSVSVHDLFSSNVRSVNGWRLADTLLTNGKADETIYTFVHKDGSEFTGTRIMFKRHTSVCSKPLFIPNTKNRSTKGWSLKQADN